MVIETTNPGYIYILINYSMPSVIKIGKTQRSPLTRVAELSSPTGIPTPFILVYDVLVPDADKAEQLMHTKMAEKGFRISDDREFFIAPLHEVVKLLIGLRENMISNSLSGGIDNENVNPPSVQDQEYRVKLKKERLFNNIKDVVSRCWRENYINNHYISSRTKLGYSETEKFLDLLEDFNIVRKDRTNSMGKYKVLISQGNVDKVLLSIKDRIFDEKFTDY